MGKKLIIGFISIFLASVGNYSLAQFSAGGGLSSFHGLNTPVNRLGFNAFVEIPKATDATLFIRASLMLPDKLEQIGDIEAKDITTQPSKTTAELVTKTSYFAVDGGTRNYFINDYDVGLSIFAGPHIKGILASYSSDYRVAGGLNPDDYQTTDFPAQELNSSTPIYSLLFAFGGTVGVKYQLPYRGALLFDVGVELVTRLHDPSAILGNEIAPLSFSFNLGYRFDWY
ncbi:hypothetical protein [Brumimicrobium mesophilum]|uniref:hypothetical protein n=1 Tax=Brumimicrobium mesophilum TaxID=392717 RepID=UPI000D144124|nr:hypothetical protein [Brumimicrobium mesophilum]